jgi:hypothetical protein
MTPRLDVSRYRPLLSATVAIWLPIAVAATLLTALVYAVVQQDLRLTANDPQIRRAEDAATALASGQSPQAVAGGAPVDMARSLAPYLIVFDDSGHPLASSGTLDGQIPTPPAGVFQYVATHGEERLTWQPRPDVRVAAVVVRYTGAVSGYVLAGRSLREVERREDQMLTLATLAWTATIGATFVASALAAWIRRDS